MLCYRCGSHAPDGSESCGACGQKFTSDPLHARATGSASLTPRKPPPPPTEASAFKEGDVLESRYRIQGLIGMGPIGQLYKAFDQELDITVALKAISPRLLQTADERKAFSQEIRLARKFSHQNLIHVHADGTENNWPFFTMQLLEGLTLRRIIDLRSEKAERFSLREIEPIFVQLAAALDAAHEIGPHGGLKPENVIVLPDLLKLTDFGLGLALPRQPFIAAQRTRSTHFYFAPEYVAGHEDVDFHIDIYAMGVILGEMLAGVRPQDGNTPELRRTAPKLPPSVEALYRRALNENPLCRHETASEFVSELSAIISALPEEETPLPEEISINVELTPPAPMAPPPIPEMASINSAVATPTPAHPKGPSSIPVDFSSARPSRAPRQAKKKSALPIPLIVVLGLSIGAGGPLAVWFMLHRMPPNLPKPQPHEVAVVQPPSPPLPPLLAITASQGTDDSSEQVPVSAFQQPLATVPPAHQQPDKTFEKQPEVPLTIVPQKPSDPQPIVSIPVQPKAIPTPKEPDTKPETPILQPSLPTPEPAKASPSSARSKGTKLDDDSFEAKTTRVNPAPANKLACPTQMKLIPSGTFKAGTTEDDPMRGFGERTLASTPLPAYCIDAYEFPNRKGAQPKGGVTYALAEAACAKEGKRLCTENEWERACKGARSHRFPYGDSFEDGACNTQDASGQPRTLHASGESKRCVSSFGVADLSGNLAEWTSSPYNDRGTGKAIKGGAANRPDHASRCSARRNGPTNKAESDEFIGFRCCADPR